MNKSYYIRHNPVNDSNEVWMRIARTGGSVDQKGVRYNLFSNATKFLTPEIKKVIHNNPATVVFWGDGTKTVVKCQEEDRHGYSERVGLLMCIAKKFFGNTGGFNDILTEHSADDIPDFKLPTFDQIKIESVVENALNKKN